MTTTTLTTATMTTTTTSVSRVPLMSIWPRQSHKFWNTTTPSSSSIPTPLAPNINIVATTPQTSSLVASAIVSNGSSLPPTTVLTSFSESIIEKALNSISPSPASSTVSSFVIPSQQFAFELHRVCIGNGIDTSSEGILASLILPSAIGLVLWLLFAIIRPRFRQIYALREWFVPQNLRPRLLGPSIFAFLAPHVPLIPSVPSDVSNIGRSTPTEAELFPSDEELNQRVLWTGFLIVLGWSVLGLAGALPLYIVNTPCLAHLPSLSVSGDAHSTIQDLSLIRLLNLFDDRTTNSFPTGVRAKPNASTLNPRVRIIILTVLSIVLGVLPALWWIIKELNVMIVYRKFFIDVRCGGQEMGWLSATKAPGFVGWGEKRLKDFILKSGLSLSMEQHNGTNDRPQPKNGERRTRKTEEQQPLYNVEEAALEVDIRTLFSIGDTQVLAMLIDERDEILENLEIAETRYISSFRVTTPDPSIIDYEPPPPPDMGRPYISRPIPLGQNRTRKSRGRRRRANPAFATSSLSPTSFVAPSQYYKLRSVQGVSGGRFTDSVTDQHAGLTESINSRMIDSRLLESNRNSIAFGRLPLGSHIVSDKGRQLRSSRSLHDESWRFSAIPDPRLFGPNYAIDEVDETGIDELGMRTGQRDDDKISEDEWVDLRTEVLLDGNSEPNEPLPSSSTFKKRTKKVPVPMERRESFPMRRDHAANRSSLPPHLRLQPSQPFVRPLDGFNFEDLGHVYADITQWRSKLKIINTEIAEVQRECYNDIADGARIKGWLMVGRGLRFIPGIQLIEGRAKEDIRWDVLQNERGTLDYAVLWAIVVVVTVLLAAGLTAVSGLALATSPDVTHYLPFFQPLLRRHPLEAGIATVLAPAVAAILFTFLALFLVHWAANLHGSVSISGGQLFVFKLTFFVLTFVATIWLVTVGALLFALRAFGLNTRIAKSVANGSIYMSILALSIIISLAIVSPALLLLQPFRLWHVLHAEHQAVTPRQRFRAVYPQTYNPSLATGASILAVIFASLFSLIFPVIGPAVAILLLLTLIAHRFLVGYVYGRTHSQTGGLLQIWFLKRLGTITCFQPILLGLILLSRELWIEGGILVGVGIAVMLFVEVYVALRMRIPGRNTLSPIIQNSLNTFEVAAWSTNPREVDDEGTSRGSSNGRGQRVRGSMASVLEMMSVTLAVMPGTQSHLDPIPLQTETLDDLTATERAARTHPDAPPHLPPLPFTDHAEEVVGILYAPELIAPMPIIWLPNDSAGVARSEAVDLQRYHDLQVTLDVRTREDVMPRRSSSSRGRPS